MPVFLEVLSLLSPNPCSVSRAQEILRERTLQNTHTYVVVDGRNEVHGTGSVHVLPKFCHAARPVGLVEDVVVLPSHQGLGLGKLLVEHLVNEALALGCYKVTLYCDQDVVSFYERCGFEEVGSCMRTNAPGVG